jgi:SAM-dependent methyltransferase
VLEIGCGRGGGAALLCRRFAPARYLGVDFAPTQITLARRRFADVPGLQLAVGDAEALALPAAGFDAVINIESSHGYGSFPRFAAGVRRALAPGGRFAWLDFRHRDEEPALRRDLAAAGLRIVRERDITANVLRALDLDAERRLALATERVARVLRAPAKIFCAVKGSWTHRRLERGASRYLHLLLEGA